MKYVSSASTWLWRVFFRSWFSSNPKSVHRQRSWGIPPWLHPFPRMPDLRRLFLLRHNLSYYLRSLSCYYLPGSPLHTIRPSPRHRKEGPWPAPVSSPAFQLSPGDAAHVVPQASLFFPGSRPLQLLFPLQAALSSALNTLFFADDSGFWLNVIFSEKLLQPPPNRNLYCDSPTLLSSSWHQQSHMYLFYYWSFPPKCLFHSVLFPPVSCPVIACM